MRTIPLPQAIYIEPTNDCNLDCVMCPRADSAGAPGHMDLAFFRSVVDQIVAIDAGIILYLHLTGEPLLHPEIADMVAYAKGSGIAHVRFSTNGTLLTRQLSTDLVAAGLDGITISMDSRTGGVYCPLAGEPTAVIDDNVRDLIEARTLARAVNPQIRMRIIDMPAARPLIEGFRRRWEHVVDSVEIKPMLSWGGQIRVVDTARQPVPLESRSVCVNALAQLTVRHDGRVGFCCLYMDDPDDQAGIIGDLRRESLAGIVSGARRRAIATAMFRHDWESVPYCGRCPDWRDYARERQSITAARRSSSAPSPIDL